ncbi:zf-HC2 domain-containing protein [uncultured Gimesia sp.]|uniref:zf-HC2 domain-containing protein n=1 Tax=uncultured Gimesia sp. TaxID=1678688 RepID=UPI0030D7F775|tara:strand:+ start:99061 stop:99534 length:474 start_codon:yes stop_codon:yes gene_type:complete
MNKNNSVKHQPDSEGEWSACPAGNLCKFVSVMKKRKQISHFITGAEILTVCLAIGLIGFLGMNQFSSEANQPGQRIAEKPCPGGLYCKEVLAHAKGYVAHTLDQELTQKVDAHLADCPHCQKKVDQLKANAHNNAANQKAALQKQAAWETYLLALNQ